MLPHEVLRLHSYDASGAVLLQLDYTRDRSGLITNIVELNQGVESEWIYRYDDLKRHVSADYVTTSTSTLVQYSYTYDRNGNRLSNTIDDVATNYTYNDLDQLVRESAPGANKRLHLDKHGRLKWTENNLGAVERPYACSVDDRLLSVRMGDSSADPVINCSYDSSGTRVARSALDSDSDSDAERTRYLVDARNLTGYSQALAEADSEGTALCNYLYGQEHGALAQARLSANRASRCKFPALSGLADGEIPYDRSPERCTASPGNGCRNVGAIAARR